MPTDDEWKRIIELDALMQFNEVVNSPRVNWGRRFLDLGSESLGEPLPSWHTCSTHEPTAAGTMFTFGPPVKVGSGQDGYYFTAPPGRYTKVCPMVERDWDLAISSCVRVIGGSSMCAVSFPFRTVASILEMKIEEYRLGNVYTVYYTDDTQEFPCEVSHTAKKVPGLLIGPYDCTSAEIEYAVKSLGVNPDYIESIMYGGHPCFLRNKE